MIATIPRHAASALRRFGLALAECPLQLPDYPVPLGWRVDAQRDPALLQLRDLIAELMPPLLGGRPCPPI